MPQRPTQYTPPPNVVRTLALGILVSGLVALSPASARAQTDVVSDIVTNTTWTQANSPYVVAEDITVAAGATLTIQEGVEVQFASYAGLTVYGRILAQGRAGAPITFTGMGQTAGDWDGISILGTPEAPLTGSRFEHVIIEYGGWNWANLTLTHASVTIAHTVIRSSDGDGILGHDGVFIEVSDTRFTDNRGYAVNLTDGSVDPRLARLTASGNGTDGKDMNGVAIGPGAIASGTYTWENIGLPYFVLGDLRVQAGAQMTVAPGVELRFAQYSGLTVQGLFTALGTDAAPILFTAIDKSPGGWDGISFEGGDPSVPCSSAPCPVPGTLTGSRLDRVTIEYGGWEGGNIRLLWAHVRISNAVITDSDDHGIFASAGGLADVSATSFARNQGYAMRLDDGSLDLKLERLSATGNGHDAVAIGGGTTSGTQRWEQMGLPYFVLGDIEVPSGATLVVEPGVEVFFVDYAGIRAYGTLVAVGSPTAPILFSAINAIPSGWDGITLEGTDDVRNEGSTLAYVTIEYGGWQGGNLILRNARAHVSHAILRYSGEDNVLASHADGSVIEQSQLLSPAAGHHGINVIEPGYEQILATYNWWGSSNGPLNDACNPAGSGVRVTPGVVFMPFLTAPDQELGTVPPLGVLNLTVTPRRWFVPSDGMTQGWVTITLRDGRGEPVPGRVVRLTTSLGEVVDGGMTDVQGRSFAYVISESLGEALLTASLDADSTCEPYRAATTSVVFTTSGANPLMPEAEAPYLTEGIEIDPEPITQGVPTTVRARLRNPNPYPILVDATIGFATLGLGLTFGPIAEVTQKRIEANAEGVIEVPWTPAVSGHYCIQLEYTATSANSAGLVAQSGSSGRGQRNLDVKPGNLRSPRERNTAQKARDAIGRFNDAKNGIDAVTDPAGLLGFQIPSFLFGKILDFNFDTWGQVSDVLGGGDGTGSVHQWKSVVRPFALDVAASEAINYQRLARIEPISFEQVTEGRGVSAARASAANDLMRAALDTTAAFKAMIISDRRYAAASAANDLTWASQQAAAYLFFKTRAGSALMRFADALDAFVAVLHQEDVSSWPITFEQATAYLDRLRTQGFDARERQAAALLGIDEAGLEVIRQRRLAKTAEQIAGDLIESWRAISPIYRELGQALTEMRPISPSTASSVATRAANGLGTAGDNLARIGEQSASFEVGNPLSTRATIELKVRRLDVPPDWMVSLSQTQVTLEPGEQKTITVHLRPGASLAQRTRPRLAVEGYAQGQLLGGVVVDTLVPHYVAIGAQCQGAGDKPQGTSCVCSLDCQQGLACTASTSASGVSTKLLDKIRRRGAGPPIRASWDGSRTR